MRELVLLAIVFCLFVACAIWIATPQPPLSQGKPVPTPLPPTTATRQVEAVAQAIATHLVPDPRFTPGATNSDVTQDNIDSTICVPGFTKSIRPPARYTSRLKRQQLDDPARNYHDREMRDYEEDHDVPLEVGGNPIDPRNLWPEPLHGPWNAHTKDKLENLIHKLVCVHRITLAEGQAAFLGDWIAAHQKYVVGR